MCEIDSVHVVLGRVFKGQAVVVLSIAIVVRLQRIYVLIQNLVGTELFVATEG